MERLFAMGRRRKWLALLVFAGVLVPGVTFVKNLPNVYRSNITMLVEPQGSETPVAGELEARLHTIHLEILSRARLLDLISRFRLYPDLRGRVPEETLVEHMRRDIQTKLNSAEHPGGPGPTVSFTLSYRGRDTQTVALVANTLASFYLEEDAKIRERQASETVQVLKWQLDGAKTRLEDRERRLGHFQDQNLGELPQQTDLNLATVARLSEQLRFAIDERSKLVERREELSRRLTETQASSSEPEGMAARIARLNAELQDLKRRFSDRYPDVIRLKGEIAALERQAEEAKRQPKADRGIADGHRTLRESLREVEGELATANAEQERLRREIAAYSRRLENAPRRLLAFQDVWRDYQTTKDLYNSLLKRHEEARLTQGTEQASQLPRFRILDAAVAASTPVAPNRPQLLVIVLTLALAFAVGAAAAKERLDTSFHTADDLRAFASVPVLVSLPRVVTRADGLGAGGARALLMAAAVLLGLVLEVAASQRIAEGNEGFVWMLTGGKS